MKTVLGLFSYGGILEGTMDSVLAELSYSSQHQLDTRYSRISGDALISRSRSRALGGFMKSDADVIVMIDHDITWRPGDMSKIAKQAVEESALVGGLYCKRAFSKGWSSRMPSVGEIKFGEDGLIETPALATGFLAIPRSVVAGMEEQLDVTGPIWQKAIQDAFDAKDLPALQSLQDMSIAPIADGAYRKVEFTYKDYFRCIRAPSGNSKNIWQFLSEDWSFSTRAVYCGFKSYISTIPLLGHTGNHTFLLGDGMDAVDKKEANNGKNENDGPVDNQDKRPGGNQGDVRNECLPGGRNRPKPAGASRKASGRRKR